MLMSENENEEDEEDSEEIKPQMTYILKQVEEAELSQAHGSETDLRNGGFFQGTYTPMEGHEIITAKVHSGDITMKANARPTDAVALFTDEKGNKYTGEQCGTICHE